MVAVAQSARALDCGSKGCGFEPRRPPHSSFRLQATRLRLQAQNIVFLAWDLELETCDSNAPVAQWIERRTSDPRVAGSNPAGGATKVSGKLKVKK